MTDRTQCDRILAHLKGGKPLTGLVALDRYNVFRLAARIADLKRQGVRIERSIISRGVKRWAAYRLAH